MPRGDKTGPMGQGPRSGRGLGFCNGYDVAGYQNGSIGRGRGVGGGMGRGFRRRFRWNADPYVQAPIPQNQQTFNPSSSTATNARLNDMEQAIQDIHYRFDELQQMLLEAVPAIRRNSAPVRDAEQIIEPSELQKKKKNDD